MDIFMFSHVLLLGVKHSAAWLWLYIADCSSACCDYGLLMANKDVIKVKYIMRMAWLIQTWLFLNKFRLFTHLSSAIMDLEPKSCASTYPSVVVVVKGKKSGTCLKRGCGESIHSGSIRLCQRAFRDSKIEFGHLPVYPSSLAGPVAQVNICSCCSYIIIFFTFSIVVFYSRVLQSIVSCGFFKVQWAYTLVPKDYSIRSCLYKCKKKPDEFKATLSVLCDRTSYLNTI